MSIPPTPKPGPKPTSQPAPVQTPTPAAPPKDTPPVSSVSQPPPSPADSYTTAEAAPTPTPAPAWRSSRLQSKDGFKADRKKALGPPASGDGSSPPDSGSGPVVLAAGLVVPLSAPPVVGPPPPSPPWTIGAAGTASEAAAAGSEAAAGASRLAAAAGLAAAAAVLFYPGSIRPDQANPITGQPWPAGSWPKPMPELVEDWRKAGLLDPGKTGLPGFPPLPPGAGAMEEYDWTRKLSPPQHAYLHDLYAQTQAGLKPEDATNWPQVHPYIGKHISLGIPEGYEPYKCDERTFLRRKDGDSDKFAKLTVDEKGLIQPGDSSRLSQPGALERALRNVLGPSPANHQAHHVMPDAIVRDHPLFKAARALGKPPYNLDTFENGARLAETAVDRVPDSAKLPLHSGCHPEYNRIAKRLADDAQLLLKQLYGTLEKVPPEKLTQAALGVQQQMRDILNNWTMINGDKLF